jgi:hypothetical protein
VKNLLTNLFWPLSQINFKLRIEKRKQTNRKRKERKYKKKEIDRERKRKLQSLRNMEKT